jgi:xylan 1,4-beta-xylosidase
MKTILISLSLCLFIHAGFAQQTKERNQGSIDTFVYTNPSFDMDFRDVDVIPDGDTWYAVGTCAPYWGDEPNPGVKLYSSKNLKSWKFETLLIDAGTLPDTAWYKSRFWAPEIKKIGSKYYLTFNCCSAAGNDAHACGIAVADNIKGPYKVMTAAKPLTPFSTNDLTLFANDNKKVYAFFNGWFENGASHMYVAEIDLETCRLKEKPARVISQGPSKFGWEKIGVEGAQVIKKDNTYYLFFSSWSKGYAVGYATAKNIYGPWEKYENNPLFGSYVENDSLFFYQEGKIIYKPDCPVAYTGVGHNQVFVGPDGRYWTSYHGTINGREKAVTLIDPIWFEDGKIKTTAPTYTEQHIEISSSVIKMNKRNSGITK